MEKGWSTEEHELLGRELVNATGVRFHLTPLGKSALRIADMQPKRLYERDNEPTILKPGEVIEVWSGTPEKPGALLLTAKAEELFELSAMDRELDLQLGSLELGHEHAEQDPEPEEHPDDVSDEELYNLTNHTP